MTLVKICNKSACVSNREVFTSGEVGTKIEFEFDESWNNLIKTAVFKAGDSEVDVLDSSWEENECVIPHECLAVAGKMLTVSVYGMRMQDGALVIAKPSVYACLGKIRQGSEPCGNESAEATPTVVQQLQAQIEEIDNQISEIMEQETESSSDFAWLPFVDNEGNLSWTKSVSDISPAITNIMGPTGERGPKGDTGAAGVAGYSPVRGTDYWTDADKSAIVADVLGSLPAAEGVSF